MASLHLLIGDPPLSDAVMEALTLASIEPTEGIDFAPGALLLLDEGSATPSLLQNIEASPRVKPRVFFLGEANAGWAAQPGIEIFPKPFRLGRLLARLSLQLRSRARSGFFVFGPYRLEPQTRQLVRVEDGSIVRLTEKETALLDYLAQSGAPVGRDELLAAVWGHGGGIETHTLETHIYQLRRKLDPDGKGLSYLVNEDGAYILRLTNP